MFHYGYHRYHRNHHHDTHWFLFILAIVGAYFLGKEAQKHGSLMSRIQWEDFTTKLNNYKDKTFSQKPVSNDNPFTNDEVSI